MQLYIYFIALSNKCTYYWRRSRYLIIL